MRQCSLNSLIRLMMDRASLFFRSFLIRSTSSAPVKLEEIGLIAYIKLQCGLNPCISRSSNCSVSLQTFLQLFSHLSIFCFLLQTFRAVYQLRTSCFQPKVVGASAFFSALSRLYTVSRPLISGRQATNVVRTMQLLISLIACSCFWCIRRSSLYLVQSQLQTANWSYSRWVINIAKGRTSAGIGYFGSSSVRSLSFFLDELIYYYTLLVLAVSYIIKNY